MWNTVGAIVNACMVIIAPLAVMEGGFRELICIISRYMSFLDHREVGVPQARFGATLGIWRNRHMSVGCIQEIRAGSHCWWQWSVACAQQVFLVDITPGINREICTRGSIFHIPAWHAAHSQLVLYLLSYICVCLHVCNSRLHMHNSVSGHHIIGRVKLLEWWQLASLS